MEPGDTVIRFGEKIQGLRNQKNALSWECAEIFLGERFDWCGSLSQPEATNPHLGSQSGPGTVGLIIFAVCTQPGTSLCLTSASSILLDKGTKWKLPTTALWD